MVEGHSV